MRLAKYVLFFVLSQALLSFAIVWFLNDWVSYAFGASLEPGETFKHKTGPEHAAVGYFFLGLSVGLTLLVTALHSRNRPDPLKWVIAGEEVVLVILGVLAFWVVLAFTLVS